MRRLAGVLPGLVVSGLVCAADAAEPLIARTSQPLDLLLTQAELRSIIRSYQARTGEIPAAPFWAVANPSQAWRIFVPIPPRGLPKDEPPLQDPR